MKQERNKKDLRERLLNFSVDVIRFLATLPDKREYVVFRYQLSKSGTAMGANYEESQAAVSKKDFQNRIAICLKEATESNYWLRVIHRLGISDTIECTRLIGESSEFKNIFASIIISSRSSRIKQSV